MSLKKEIKIMTMEEILIKLKTEKLCPSHFGLINYYGLECVDGDYIVDCNHCREMSIKNNINKECPEEGNEKIRCIDCSCNLCIHSCIECDIVECEPKKMIYDKGIFKTVPNIVIK